LYSPESASAVPVPRNRKPRPTRSRQVNRAAPSRSKGTPKSISLQKHRISKTTNLTPSQVTKFYAKGDTTPYYEVFVKGCLAYRRGKYAVGLKLFTRTLSLKKDWAEAFYYRCLCRAQVGKDKEAALDFGRAIALDRKYSKRTDFADIYYNRALKDITEGKAARSILNDWRRAISIKSDYVNRKEVSDGLTKRTLALINKGQYTKVWGNVQALEKMNLKDETRLRFAVLFDQRGMQKFERRDYEKALEDFAYSLRAFPEYGRARKHQKLAANLLEKKRLDPSGKYQFENDLRDLTKAEVSAKEYRIYFDRLKDIRKRLDDLKKGGVRKKDETYDRTTIDLMQIVSRKLEIGIFDIGLVRAKKERKRRDVSKAWRISEELKSIATGPRVSAVNEFQESLSQPYANVLVVRASAYAKDEVDDAREIMKQAKALDPKNREARRWLRENRIGGDAASSEAADQGSGGGNDLYFLGLFALVVLAAGYFLFVAKPKDPPLEPTQEAPEDEDG
jgi:tetratricopeptide (TPR) repeat protein